LKKCRKANYGTAFFFSSVMAPKRRQTSPLYNDVITQEW